MPDPLIGLTIDFSDTPKQRDEAPRGGLGSQVLPVAELDDDFEGEPEDGMEYLFLVRREAHTHPKINRVANPYATEEVIERSPPPAPRHRPSEAWRTAFVKQFEALRRRIESAPPLVEFPPPSHNPIPLAQDESAWKIYINGRRLRPVKTAPLASGGTSRAALESNGTATGGNGVKSTTSIVEEDTSMALSLEDAKAAALATLELDSPAPTPPPAPVPAFGPTQAPLPDFDPSYPVHIPTPHLLLIIPAPGVIRVLSHFDDWLQERLEAYETEVNFVPSTIFAPPALRRKAAAGSAPKAPVAPPRQRPTPRPPLPTSHELQWILSLLTRLDSLLAGDDMSALRILTKTIVSLVEASEQARSEREQQGTRASVGGRTAEEKMAEEDEAERRAQCWMIVAAVASVWAQRDLWEEQL